MAKKLLKDDRSKKNLPKNQNSSQYSSKCSSKISSNCSGGNILGQSASKQKNKLIIVKFPLKWGNALKHSGVKYCVKWRETYFIIDFGGPYSALIIDSTYLHICRYLLKIGEIEK